MSAERHRQYLRPPITEAVIELQVATHIDHTAIAKIARKLKGQYPNEQQIKTISFNVDTTAGKADFLQQVDGVKLSSDDQADVLLVKPMSLTTARLAPYCGWEKLRGRAVSAWKIWRRHNERPVKRIGVRFINRIDIPSAGLPVTQLDEYLNVLPKLPQIMSGPMQAYFLQVTFPSENPLWTATINSTPLIPSPLLDHVSFLLDIDVFRTEEIHHATKSCGRLWRAFAS